MKQNDLQPVNLGFDLDIVDGNGIELYDSQGNIYLDLNEISAVLGEKNPHFIKRIC